MLTVKVDSHITIQLQELPTKILTCIMKDLTLDNPEYLQAVKYGYSIYGKERYIYLYQRDDAAITIPRGYGQKLVNMLEKNKIHYQLDDQRLTLPEVDFGSRIKLRDYQAPAVDA